MKRLIASFLPLLAFTALAAPMAQAASHSSFSQSKAEESNELSSTLSPRHIDSENQLSERFEEEFYEGLGNKGDSSSRTREEFYEGLGNKTSLS